jgi:hypothetical protein
MIAADGVEGDQEEVFRWVGGAGWGGENQEKEECREGSIPSPAKRLSMFSHGGQRRDAGE